ncbi:MAG: hypothetical protein Q8P24_06400 [Desulfobacterales bacterium]|nr:hypothetical protein [Desulfobacterales bacterium]
MNRRASILLSLGISGVLIAAGVWLICAHNRWVWPEKGRWWAMGVHSMMGEGGMGFVMIVFWIVLVAAFVLLISGVVNGIRGPKPKEE